MEPFLFPLPYALCSVLIAGKCPASPTLQAGVKGHPIKEDYLSGKPRPSGQGASLIPLIPLHKPSDALFHSDPGTITERLPRFGNVGVGDGNVAGL